LMFAKLGKSFQFMSGDTVATGVYDCHEGSITATVSGLATKVVGTIDSSGNKLLWNDKTFKRVPSVR
jgi:hypothetical protein